jgi:hypothetical protein
MNKQNSLYIFDFDETLVHDSAKAYIISKDGIRAPIEASKYHTYKLKYGESVDLREFDHVIGAVPNHRMISLLIKHLENSVILTARTEKKPIYEYFHRIGIEIPEIITVGVKNPSFNTSTINALRKKRWIEKAIKQLDLTYVEFWDDSFKNIDEVNKLKTQYPNVKIITHLVEQ